MNAISLISNNHSKAKKKKKKKIFSIIKLKNFIIILKLQNVYKTEFILKNIQKKNFFN